MRSGCLLVLVTVALLWGGGQGIYTAVSNRSVKQYTVDEYLARKPADKWLKLTGGALDLTSLNYTSFFGVGSVGTIYVPLRSSNNPLDNQTHILLETKNPALLKLAEGMRQVKNEEQARRFLQEHARELVIQKDVQGLVRFGIDLEDRKVRKLRKLNENLAQDFIVLADGESPNYLFPIVSLLGGLALAGWLVSRRAGRGSQPPGSNLPPPLPVSP